MRRLLVAVYLIGSVARAAEDFPAWAKEAITQTVPQYPAQVRMVELFHEEAVTVDPDGRRVMRERAVIKTLQSNASASAYRTYNTKNGRIRDFQAWVQAPGRKVEAVDKKRVLDVAVSRNEVYEEARAKAIEFPGTAVGTVIAYEVTEEEKTVFTQYAIGMQTRIPRLLSRFQLTLPPGWEARGMTFNRSGFEPTVRDQVHTWELRDLKPIEDEDYAPPLSSVAPFVAVSYFPPESNAAGLRGLKDWTAVSTWLSGFFDPSAEVTEKVRAKSSELTGGSGSLLAKLQALGKFVQQTNYVSVDLNVTRGGGYTPHPAEMVLTRNYGDCKDKATLMRALLKAQGIESYVTVISADDPSFVRAEWASPMQFNHAILAIVVPAEITGSAVLEQTPLGRLLLFDPTDPVTPLGDLPEPEQGSNALVVAGAKGALLKMPKPGSDASRIESDVRGVIDPSGKLTVTLSRRYFGQSGVALRSMEVFRGAPELRSRFERGFSRRVPGAVLAEIRTQEKFADQHVAVDFGVTAERFAQISAGRLFIVRPGLLTSGGEYSFEAEERKGPIQLDSDLRRDKIHIQIPAGFELDELPREAKLESPYGSLHSKWTVANGEIVMEDELEVKQTLAPAGDYAKIKDFFDRVAGAHYAPVVLIRK